MANWALWGLAACAWLVGCGGKLVGDGAHGEAGAFSAGGPGAGAPGAGAPGAGAPGAGTSTGGAGSGGLVLGHAGSEADTCSGDNAVVCAEACGSAQTMAVTGECQGGLWRCPSPFVAPETCPYDACVRQLTRCCDHQYGRSSTPECGADGLYEACAPGLDRDAPVCVAESAHTTNCGTLFDQSCTLEDSLCERNGVHCRCVPSDGGLVWACSVDVL